MTLAVFSDVHGNVYSLEKALRIMETYNPDKYLFLGDMAGYYYFQNESIELLNCLNNLVSIKGNHDEYFLNALKDNKKLKELDDKYGKSYSLLANTMTKESEVFFNNLQDCEKNNYYEAYHGSPDNYTQEYIYPDTKINFKKSIPYIFLGHTHYPMNRNENNTTVVNPGSIGQPRDYNKGSFAIVDLEDKKVENVRYEYDITKLEKKVILLNDNKYLIDVLKRAQNENG